MLPPPNTTEGWGWMGKRFYWKRKKLKEWKCASWFLGLWQHSKCKIMNYELWMWTTSFESVWTELDVKMHCGTCAVPHWLTITYCQLGLGDEAFKKNTSILLGYISTHSVYVNILESSQKRFINVRTGQQNQFQEIRIFYQTPGYRYCNNIVGVTTDAFK